MSHRAIWLPMLLGSAGFFSVTPTVAQVASGQHWGMQTERTEAEAEPEPSGPQVAPPYLWGMGVAPNESAAYSSAERGARFYQDRGPRAPAPVASNFSEADTAGIVKAFARRGDPVEDDRGSAPVETAWSRDAVRNSAAGSEFMGDSEERGSSDRQATGSFAAVSVPYAPGAADESLTIDVPRRNNRQATRSVAQNSASYAPAAAAAPAAADEALTIDVPRRNNRQATRSVAQNSVSYVPAAANETETGDIQRRNNRPATPSFARNSVSYAPAAADEAVSVDIQRRNNRPAAGRPAPVSVAYAPAPAVAVAVADEAVSVDIQRRNNRQATGLPAPVSVAYAPAVADRAASVDILRRNNRQATGSFAPVPVAYAPAVADGAVSVDILRRNNRPATGSFAPNTVSYSRAVNATVVADEASTADISRPTSSPSSSSTADISRPTSSPSSSSSELRLASSSESPHEPPVPIEPEKAVAILGTRATLEPRAVNRGRKDVSLFGSFARNSVSYASPVADEAVSAGIRRLNNRQAARSFAPVSVSYAPAVADEALTVDILRRNNRQASGSFVRNSVSYSRAVNATIVADEASMADIFGPTSSPSSYSSELVLA